jgi:hypothetical protein
MTDEETSHYKLSVYLEPFVYAPVSEGQVVGTATMSVDGLT